MNLENVFEKDKRQYIELVRERRKHLEKLVIYGVGTVGQILYDVLRKENIRVDEFCVTKKEFNKKIEQGIPIRAIEELRKEPEKTLFWWGLNTQVIWI